MEARQVAENTRALLELVGRDDVEVALGREVPLVRELMTTPETHGPKGIGYAVLPPARQPVSRRHAADLIIEEARRRPGELLLITLAPLTNVAVAVLREPELPALLRGIVMMAGSYRSPGNTAPTSEWNVAVDPEAMQVVLRAFGGPDAAYLPRALGLDVTERAKFEPRHLEELVARGGGTDNPVMRFVTDALRFYMEFHSKCDGFYGAHIHDALAVAAALDPVARPLRGTPGGRGARRHADDRRDRHRLAPSVGQAAEPGGSRGRGHPNVLRALHRTRRRTRREARERGKLNR